MDRISISSLLEQDTKPEMMMTLPSMILNSDTSSTVMEVMNQELKKAIDHQKKFDDLILASESYDSNKISYANILSSSSFILPPIFFTDNKFKKTSLPTTPRQPIGSYAARIIGSN
jgi:hypothetical protein